MMTDEERNSLTLSFWQDANFWGVIFTPIPPKVGCVYAFEMSDNTVKIGVTTNSQKRIKTVEQQVYLKVLRWHITDFAPYTFMKKVERRCHEKFADNRVRGEYFAILFEDACAELDSHNEEIAIALKVADEKYLDELDVYFNDFLPKYEAQPNKIAVFAATRPAPGPVLDFVHLQAQIDELRVQIDELRDNLNEQKEMLAHLLKAFEATVDAISKRLTITDRGEKLLQIAEMLDDSPEKQQILIEAANLFAGEKFV